MRSVVKPNLTDWVRLRLRGVPMRRDPAIAPQPEGEGAKMNAEDLLVIGKVFERRKVRSLAEGRLGLRVTVAQIAFSGTALRELTTLNTTPRTPKELYSS